MIKPTGDLTEQSLEDILTVIVGYEVDREKVFAMKPMKMLVRRDLFPEGWSDEQIQGLWGEITAATLPETAH